MSKINLTPRMFIQKANGKISALAFLDKHREYLTTGIFEGVCDQIFQDLDDKKIYPFDALPLIKNKVFNKMLSLEALEHEAKMQARIQKKELQDKIKFEKESEPKEEREEKAHQVIIYDGNNNVIETFRNNNSYPLKMNFDRSFDAECWAIRKLIHGGVDWYAQITSIKMLDKNGLPLVMKIDRKAAFSSSFRPINGPAMKKQKSSGRLGNVAKAIQTKCNFSRG